MWLLELLVSCINFFKLLPLKCYFGTLVMRILKEIITLFNGFIILLIISIQLFMNLSFLGVIIHYTFVILPFQVFKVLEVVYSYNFGIPRNYRHSQFLVIRAPLKVGEVTNLRELVTINWVTKSLENQKTTLIKGNVPESILLDGLGISIFTFVYSLFYFSLQFLENRFCRDCWYWSLRASRWWVVAIGATTTGTSW